MRDWRYYTLCVLHKPQRAVKLMGPFNDQAAKNEPLTILQKHRTPSPPSHSANTPLHTENTRSVTGPFPRSPS